MIATTDHAQDPLDPLAPMGGERVALVLLPPALLEAAVAQDPSAPTDLAWPEVAPVPAELVPSLPAAMRLAQLADDPAVAPWLVRAIVVADPSAPGSRAVVGHLGGHGAPDERGFVEVGYTVLVAARRRGLATEAARAWFAWAHRLGAVGARVSTTAHNGPSLALAARLGLPQVGRAWDEDDEVWELVHEAPLPLSPA